MAYYGIYRAKVVQREDERQRGRIKVTIPEIGGGKGKSQWVDLCMGCAYENGGDIAVPKLGDTCWIMFEKGDINLPVYMGNFFGAFKTPLPDYDEDTRVISWDNCRIEMKGETMKFIVGEKSLITITTDSISLEVGENDEGEKPTGKEDGYYNNSSGETSSDESSETSSSGTDSETSNPDETSSSGTDSETSSESGKSSIVLTTKDIRMDSKEIDETAEKDINASAGGNINESAKKSVTINGMEVDITAKKSVTINGMEVDITAKTMASMKATAEVSLMGKHIGLNDMAAQSAAKNASTSSVLTNSVMQSLGKAAVKGLISGDVMGELTSELGSQISSLGTQTLNDTLNNAVGDALNNSGISGALDKIGSLNEVLSPDTLTSLASNTGLLGAVGGIDNLNSILDTSTFSDLVNLPDITENLTGRLSDNLLQGVTNSLKLDNVLQDNLGLDTFSNMSLSDAVKAIPEVSDILSSKGSVGEVFSDSGVEMLAQNNEFISQAIDSNYQAMTAGDEDFADFDANQRIQELSNKTFLPNKE